MKYDFNLFKRPNCIYSPLSVLIPCLRDRWQCQGGWWWKQRKLRWRLPVSRWPAGLLMRLSDHANVTAEGEQWTYSLVNFGTGGGSLGLEIKEQVKVFSPTSGPQWKTGQDTRTQRKELYIRINIQEYLSVLLPYGQNRQSRFTVTLHKKMQHIKGNRELYHIPFSSSYLTKNANQTYLLLSRLAQIITLRKKSIWARNSFIYSIKRDNVGVVN